LRSIDIEDLTTRTTLAETTALLDRTKLLARIEDFQRTKALVEACVEAPPPSVVPLPPASDDAIVTRVTELRSRDSRDDEACPRRPDHRRDGTVRHPASLE
jgi:hypothetical protein